MNLTMTDSTFKSFMQPSTNLTNNPIQGGAFRVENCGVKVSSMRNTYKNSYNSTKGGAFSLINASLEDTNSTFTDHIASKGGVFYCQDCTLNLTNPVIHDNIADQGGVFHIVDDLNFTS